MAGSESFGDWGAEVTDVETSGNHVEDVDGTIRFVNVEGVYTLSS